MSRFAQASFYADTPAAQADVDSKLESQLALFFSGRRDGVRTPLCEVGLFLGEQWCRVSNASVRMIVVNTIDVEPGYRHRGIFKHLMRLLTTRFAIQARAPILELNAVRNAHLYTWALRQPNVFVSPYTPESVFLYLDFSATEAPAALKEQSRLLLSKLREAPNMANTYLTQDLFARLRASRQAKVYDFELTPDVKEESLARLPSQILHDACKPWIRAEAERRYARRGLPL